MFKNVSRLRRTFLLTAEYSLPPLLATAVFIRMCHLTHWNLSWPMGYGGDGLLILFVIKTLAQTSWAYTNPNVGAPGIFHLHDFAISTDSFYLLMMKLLSYVNADPVWILNAFYLIRFPLTASATYSVLKRFKIAYPLAVAFAVIFTFAPYNLLRGQGHLFVGTYFILPWVLLVMFWTINDEITLSLRNQKLLASILICAILGGSGIYHAFFACAFFSLTAVYAILSTKHWSVRRVVVVAIPPAVTVATIVAESIPIFLYVHDHGKNLLVAQRQSWEAELYGMKIIQLLLPIGHHRLSLFRAITSAYNQVTPLVTENVLSSLGLLGSVGFLFLILWIVLRSETTVLIQRLTRWLGLAPTDEQAIGHLARLNLFAVLLATIGGFGSVLALLFFPAIRAYNRISIYIALFALMAVALVVDRLLKNKAPSGKRWLPSLVAILLGFFAVFDQTGLIAPPSSAAREEFDHDREYVRSMTRALPKRAMVFQLPYFPFPEHAPIHKMPDYEHLKMYFHSDTDARWSYPAMTGRADAIWLKDVASLPIPDMIYRLQDKGFTSIYVDGLGYEDGAVHLVNSIGAFLHTQPVSDSTNRRFFFPTLPTNVTVKFSESGRYPVSLTIQDPSRKLVLPTEINEEALKRRLSQTRQNGPVTLRLVRGDGLADYDALEHDIGSGTLPNQAFQSEIQCERQRIQVAPGSKDITIGLRVTNQSSVWWPRRTQTGEGVHLVQIRAHLMDENLKVVDPDFKSILPLPKALGPSKTANLQARLSANLLPEGTSYIEYDMVQEHYHWAKDLGGKTCIVEVVK